MRIKTRKAHKRLDHILVLKTIQVLNNFHVENLIETKKSVFIFHSHLLELQKLLKIAAKLFFKNNGIRN